MKGHDASKEVSLQLRFREGSPTDSSKPVGALAPAGIEIAFRHDQDTGRAVLTRMRVTDALDRVMLSRHEQADGTYSYNIVNPPASVPEKEAAPETIESARDLMKAIRAQVPQKFLFDPNEVVASIWRLRERSGDSKPSWSIPDQAAYYMAILSTVNKLTSDFLENVAYIGPLREPFRRHYEWGGNSPCDVGIGGSRAPELIAARWNDPKFQKWVLAKLADFGFKGGLEVDRATNLRGFRLMVKSSPKSEPANIADSGFGLSQVLPFIVFGGYAEAGSMLIAEQPEIHLNPKLQIRLAHLLVALVRQRKVNVVIETHSEHLLSELRLLVAKHRLPPADLGVIYVEKGTSASSVRDVPVEPDGQVPTEAWPKGFFEEPVTQALELLSLAPFDQSERSDGVG